MKKYDWSKDKDLFEDVFFLVESTSYEQHNLWLDWSRDSIWKRPSPTVLEVSWKQDRGYTVEIGRIDKRPICVNISYDYISGKKIMFYDGCSELIDNKMIEEWLKHNFTRMWDKGTRWSQCNAQNFHLCLTAIKENEK